LIAFTLVASCFAFVAWERRVTRQDQAILSLANQENARVMSLGPWFSREINIVYPPGSKITFSAFEQFSGLWRHGVFVLVSSSDLTDSLRVQLRENMPRNCKVYVRGQETHELIE
jgi:hypothetical protein